MRIFILFLSVVFTSGTCVGEDAAVVPGQPDIFPGINEAIRLGNSSQAWNAFINGSIEHAETEDVSRKLLLLDKGIEICLISGNPKLAMRLSHAARETGIVAESEWEVRRLLREAEIHFARHDYSAMKTVLDDAAALLGGTTSESELAMLFALKSLHAWLTHHPIAANEFIEAVLFDTEEHLVSRPRAIALLTLAMLVQSQDKEDSLVATNLQLARKALIDESGAIVFQSMLANILKLHPGESIRLVDSVLLEFARRGDRYACPSVAATGSAARAELFRREGDLAASVNYLQRSQFLAEKAVEEWNRQEDDWEKVKVRFIGSAVKVDGTISTYQIILTLLLIVLMLVLMLRIRTQRIVNRQLVESVEKSMVAEQTAEHASRLKSQFVANVSHEIKTPMSGLVGMVSLLEELIVDPVQRKYLRTIQTCSRNLLVILNDLLDLGRIESNRLEIESESFPILETIRYCEQVVQMKAREKGLRLEVETSAALPDEIIGDSTRISQIIINLLNNAIKFTATGSVRLKVDFEETIGRAGRLLVNVEDTGTGIEKERLKTVFEPFNQGPPPDDREGTGSGLGLAISKRLTDHMGGSLVVRSEYGQGSVFTLSLPVKLPEF